jgi:hypothetical protein
MPRKTMCGRCNEMPARFWRETLAVCELCAARLDARADVQAAWTNTVRRDARTFSHVYRAWEAR